MSKVNFSYEFCGLKLDVEAIVEAGEPQTHTNPGTEDSAEIISAYHKEVELDLDEMDKFIELEKAALKSLQDAYVDSAISDLESEEEY